MKNWQLVPLIKSFLLFYDKLVQPSFKLKDSPDYYRTKIFNSFALFSILATIFNSSIRFIQFIFLGTDLLLVINSIFLTIGILLLFFIGKSKYYRLGFIIFPSLPLLAIWVYYFPLKKDLTYELLLINPTSIIILGIIVAGLIMSLQEFIVFSFISNVDVVLFYGLLTNFSLDLIIPRVLLLLIVISFMGVSTHFRLISFKYLNESNKKLSKEVEIKHNDLIHEKSILYSLIGNLKEGVLIFDYNNKPILANNSFLTKYKEITGLKFDLNEDLIVGKDKTDYFYNFIIKSKENLSMSEIHEKNNKYYLLESNMLKINLDSKIIGIMIEIKEITDLKKVEILEKNFRQVIMHELRTPTTSLQLSVSNLTKYWEKLSGEDIRRLLLAMEKSTEKFADIIKKITILSDLELREQLTFFDTNVKAFIQEVNKTLLNEINIKTNRKILVLDTIKTNAIIKLNKDLIFLAINNIIDNAIKFSSESSEIRIVYSCRNQQYFCIEIIDQGIGIDENEIQFVSNRFYKGKKAENLPGEGMGLSISKEIIFLHNGELEIVSKNDEGTKITLLLPIAKLLN